jgi:5-hydroxyisourate hydrolase
MISVADAPAGRLTVHVLDTARGTAAQGLKLTLSRLEQGAWQVLGACHTNADGRCDQPLLAGEALHAGTYQIVFEVAAWRSAQGNGAAGFYDTIPIRFRITDQSQHYHVPLLLSPFGYTTYRGS